MTNFKTAKRNGSTDSVVRVELPDGSAGAVKLSNIQFTRPLAVVDNNAYWVKSQGSKIIETETGREFEKVDEYLATIVEAGVEPEEQRYRVFGHFDNFTGAKNACQNLWNRRKEALATDRYNNVDETGLAIMRANLNNGASVNSTIQMSKTDAHISPNLTRVANETPGVQFSTPIPREHWREARIVPKLTERGNIIAELQVRFDDSDTVLGSFVRVGMLPKKNNFLATLTLDEAEAFCEDIHVDLIPVSRQIASRLSNLRGIYNKSVAVRMTKLTEVDEMVDFDLG